MACLDNITLANYDDEDIFDIVAKLETSFAIKFDERAFITVKTFGDLCRIIESHINHDNKEGCTKQQAFYKIRLAISETILIDKGLVNLDSKLADFFPRHNRRTLIKKFRGQLGISLKLLTYPNWIALTLTIGVLSSLIAFFFDWKIAVSGSAFFILAFKVADILGKEFKFETVKEVTEYAATEHYIDVRRSKFTVNRNEILATIKDAFSTGLLLDKEQLTPDAKFNWA